MQKQFLDAIIKIKQLNKAFTMFVPRVHFRMFSYTCTIKEDKPGRERGKGGEEGKERERREGGGKLKETKGK